MSPPLSEHSAERALFDNTLSYAARLPVAFVPGAGAGRLEHAQSLLHSLGMIEDHRCQDSQNGRDEDASFGQRLEAKIDLNLLLLGHLLEQVVAPLPVRSTRWSIRGIRVQQADGGHPPAGTGGVVQIRLCECFPEVLELPVSVVASDADQGWVWLSFPAFAQGLHEALERHLFRLHRRQLAQARTTLDSR